MKGLIQKSGYIKPGSGGGHYAEYIATRDGVELMEPTTGGGYLEYIAERPRSHGLFSADGLIVRGSFTCIFLCILSWFIMIHTISKVKSNMNWAIR